MTRVPRKKDVERVATHIYKNDMKDLKERIASLEDRVKKLEGIVIVGPEGVKLIPEEGVNNAS